MPENPPSTPYDAADYLQTPEDIAEYLEAVMEDCDDPVFASAFQDAVRAAKRIMPSEMSGFSDQRDDFSFNRLASLLRILGYELAFRPKQAA